MLKEYINYLKDNPKGYWFKAKLYGWGWTPVKWQGWLAVFIYITLVLTLVISREQDIPGNPDSGSNFLTFALPIIVLTILLIFICYKKGEKPRWQWGAKKNDWSDYYKATQNRQPRPLLVKALEFVVNKNSAIDIGGGALNDTKYLLDQGFEVTVIDKSPLVKEQAKKIPSGKLNAFTSSFEDFNFSSNKYDIASAMFALPFSNPNNFNTTFTKIKNSLNEGGVFCGQFFGKNDTWSKNQNMTFHDRNEVMGLLQDMDIISIDEVEKDDKTAAGDMKHWHVFHIIARKK